MQKYDVVVVGGGPAGCSTAINCASLGLEVLLLEKDSPGKRKPCGGVLPWITSEVIEDILGAEMPSHVFNSPAELGLYYVPPSGRENSGRVPKYRIHNIIRERFDEWLLKLASDSGVEVVTEARFTGLSLGASIEVTGQKHDETLQFDSDYVVGADGVRSTVRRMIKPESVAPAMIVGQELWSDWKKSDIEDCFYGFFRGDISIAYSYVIPKGDNLLIGLGVEPRQTPNVIEALGMFRTWLREEFNFQDKTLISKEAWGIPFGYHIPGKDNVLLVGDAAGLCNPLSGEGIRLGIESGESAASAISRSMKGADLLGAYSQEVGGLADMVHKIYEFVLSLDDIGRETFVKEELSRGII
ncbi:MAG: NAD(P)/FAD-dependent oxidoreductase [Candidatus Thorarchaeota archaeon]|jgi:geranylgeranyl reductase family protein